MSDFSWNEFDAQKSLDDNPPMTFEPIPSGWYPTVITGSEWKATNGKTGPGKMLVLVAECIDPKYKGKKCWNNFNLINNDDTTRNIAKGRMGQLTLSMGVAHPRHESELHNKPVLGHWMVKPAGDYPAKNEIEEWKPINSSAPTTGRTTEPRTPDPAPAPSNKKPWEK